jgi:hypothetical protein
MCMGSRDRQPAVARPVGRGDDRHRANGGGGGEDSGVPLISLSNMPHSVLFDGCCQIAKALKGSSYALIGGAACSLLGSRRGTYDIDIIVPTGQRGRTVELLGRSKKFGVEPGATRTWFNSSNDTHYNVDVMEPGQIYQKFDRKTETRVVNGIRILKPALLLNFKCLSWSSRGRQRAKRLHDAQDIRFLVTYMARAGERTSPREVNFADEDFLLEFLARYPETRHYFVKIGLLRQ